MFLIRQKFHLILWFCIELDQLIKPLLRQWCGCVYTCILCVNTNKKAVEFKIIKKLHL